MLMIHYYNSQKVNYRFLRYFLNLTHYTTTTMPHNHHSLLTICTPAKANKPLPPLVSHGGDLNALTRFYSVEAMASARVTAGVSLISNCGLWPSLSGNCFLLLLTSF